MITRSPIDDEQVEVLPLSWFSVSKKDGRGTV